MARTVDLATMTRMVLSLGGVEEVEGGVRVWFHDVFEIEGVQKPALVADAISMYFTS